MRAADASDMSLRLNVGKSGCAACSKLISWLFMNSRSSLSNSSDTDQTSPELYTQQVVGAAVFDLSGLPQEYFISADTSNVSWVQTVFQALGLQSLLLASLKLEGFRHATVHTDDYRAIVFRQRTGYTALLLQQHTALSPEFMKWARTFEPTLLKIDPRFSLI